MLWENASARAYEIRGWMRQVGSCVYHEYGTSAVIRLADCNACVACMLYVHLCDDMFLACILCLHPCVHACVHACVHVFVCACDVSSRFCRDALEQLGVHFPREIERILRIALKRCLCVHAYIPAYVPMCPCLRACVPACVSLSACVPACVSACVPLRALVCVRACMRVGGRALARLPAYLPARLCARVPARLSACPPACLACLMREQ